MVVCSKVTELVLTFLPETVPSRTLVSGALVYPLIPEPNLLRVI
jgi:hypothetical protein